MQAIPFMLGTTLFVNVPSGKSSVFFGHNIAIESFNHFPKGQTSMRFLKDGCTFITPSLSPWKPLSFLFSIPYPLSFLVPGSGGNHISLPVIIIAVGCLTSIISQCFVIFFLSLSSPVRLFQIFVTFPQFSTGPFHRT